MGEYRSSSRGSAAATARAFSLARGHRGRSAAQRSTARSGRARHIDPPAAGAACTSAIRTNGTPPRCAGSNGRRAVSDGAARKEIADTVCAVLSEPAFLGFVRRGFACRSAACRDPAGWTCRRRHRRPAAGRGGPPSRSSTSRPAACRNRMIAIPASHRAQMSAYTEALRVIFPGREVRAVLLYTSGPRLFELQC